MLFLLLLICYNFIEVGGSMKPWSKDEIIYLENYEDEYLNMEASKRFYNLYRDIISEEDKDSYISVNDAIKIYNLVPRQYIDERYTITKRTTPLTTSGINKLKCSMLMSVGIMCSLSMTKIGKKDIENKFGIVVEKSEDGIYQGMKEFLDKGFKMKKFTLVIAMLILQRLMSKLPSRKTNKLPNC